MSRSYPIWVEVDACIYKSSKSYGAKDTNNQKIYVGTSKNNSHLLARITTTKRIIDEQTFFKLRIDGKVIKTIVMNNKTKEIKKVSYV